MKLFGSVIVVLLLVLAAGASAAAATKPLDVATVPGDVFDAGDLAQRVLAQHWKELGPREQDEFIRLFRDVVTRSLARIRARVSSDIVVDGESLVANYRSQFHAILGTSSVAGLLERMRADASREDARAPEPETTRGRLMASLLVGFAMNARGTR
jgi:hypothetical protein